MPQSADWTAIGFLKKERVSSLSAVVEANVRRTVRDVLESAEGRARTAEGEMTLVGAVYDLATGRVRFLD